MSVREDGFYWIILKGRLEVAEYKSPDWTYLGSDICGGVEADDWITVVERIQPPDIGKDAVTIMQEWEEKRDKLMAEREKRHER